MAKGLEGLIERLEHELPNTKLKADGCGWALFKADDVEDAILALRLLGEVEVALSRLMKFGFHEDGEAKDWDEWVCARSALDKLRKGISPESK